MSSKGLHLWARIRCSCPSRVVIVSRSSYCLKGPGRSYATQNSVNVDFGNANSSLFKQPRTFGRTTEPKQDYVGPFQLGVSPASLRQGEKIPRWSELSTTGKVMRTTARTTNLGVILLGAGLSVLLIYSLTSELFSKNSPTVLYGNACERIKQSEPLASYLNSPLTFHNNPPSSVRPRHRNRHVNARVMIDQYGQEHMVMTFYVQGRLDGETLSPSQESYMNSATAWIQDKAVILTECSFDDSLSWLKENIKNTWDKSIKAFKYLSGDPLPPPPLPDPQPVQDETKKNTGAWSFAGIFSSLKGQRLSRAETSPKPLGGKKFTEGEVHADLVKNKDGYFVFRYLLVDIPSSRDRNSTRIFIERQPGVRETESVIRWASS